MSIYKVKNLQTAISSINELGKSIFPKKNTVLSNLFMTATRNINSGSVEKQIADALIHNTSEYDVNIDNIVSNMLSEKGIVTGDNPLADDLNAIIKTYSKVIQFNVDLATTQVLPLIVTICEKVDKYCEKTLPMEGYTIDFFNNAPEYLDGDIKSFLENTLSGKRVFSYGHMTYLPVFPNTPLVTELTDGIVAEVLTSNKLNDFKTVVANSNIARHKDGYVDLLKGILGNVNQYRSEEAFGSEMSLIFKIDDLDSLLYIICLVKAYRDLDDPSLVGNMTLNQYRSTLDNILSVLAGVLLNHIDKLQVYMKEKVLVLSQKSSGVKHKLSVYKPVYDEWVRGDGDIDILYGLMVSDKLYRTVEDISNNKEHLLKYRANAIIHSNEGNEVKREKLVKDIIANTLISNYDKLKDIQNTISPNLLVSPVNLGEQVRNFMSVNPISKSKTVHEYVLNLLNELLLKHTELFNILNLFSVHSLKHPEYSTQDSLTLALHDFLVRTLLDQIHVGKK